MAKLDEKHVAIARVYSQAMLDLAPGEETARELLGELDDLVELCEKEPAFGNYLTSPMVDQEKRAATLDRVLRGRSSDLLVDSLQVINRHGRLGILETIVETFRSGFQDRHKQVDVRVTTAIPLSDTLRERLHATAAELTGRQPQLITAVDPSLIGGLVLEIDDRKFDTTVRKDLKIVRGQLADRAAREILGSRAAAAE